MDWGVDLVGFASVDAFSNYEPEHRPFFNFNLGRPKTVIVIGMHMVDPALDLWIQPSAWNQKTRKSRNFTDEILRGIAYRVSLFLEREHHYKTKPAPYAPGLFLKDAGVLAGLGVIGRNNLLITRQFGPRVRLRAILTEAPLAPDERQRWDPCRSCNHPCIEVCPADALTNAQYDRERCLNYCLVDLQPILDTSSARMWCVECALACPVGEEL